MSAEKVVECTITPDSFWQSVNILLTKPHVVNKRLWGSKTLLKLKCKPTTSDWRPPVQCAPIENLPSISVDTFKEFIKEELQLEIDEDDVENDIVIEVILTELLPKNYADSHAFQLACLNKYDVTVNIFDVTPEKDNQNLCPKFSYMFHFKSLQVILTADSDVDSKSFKWLTDAVLPQFVKWGQECTSTEKKTCLGKESLALVSVDKYYKKYNELKLKYGKDMVKIWPECTDPTKFVYEDVAIATYLLLLWEDERKHKNLSSLQSFVDLGCGNGLLVYILTKEGHSGVGIDVRKRQIWDMYGTDVKLEERTITPSDVHLFPDSNWLIGNHSDELTPWIPVIAARSSYKCNFFLLPCCAYNFDGSKYQRQNSSKSQYTEYLEYIKQLCEDVGFITNIDRLKIPSTKRICLVGRGRKHNEEQFEDNCNYIQKLINASSSSTSNIQSENATWIEDFKSRNPVEKVKNCTQIDKNLIESIIYQITRYLLEECNVATKWNVGRTAGISELVHLIPQDQLKALKSECGGLQTLIKNNHHIFKVQSGKVQLRYPKTVEEVMIDSKNKKNKSKSTNIRIQVKPCWFYNNHPQGCPLTDAKCSFLHIKS